MSHTMQDLTLLEQFPAAIVPDFIREHIDGEKSILEVREPSRVNSDEVKRKRKAAEMWCKRRGMEYVITTVD